MRSGLVLAGELMGFCIKVLENLLCSFNQLDHVSIRSQNNLQRFCRLLFLTSELINTRTHYIVCSFLGPLSVVSLVGQFDCVPQIRRFFDQLNKVIT